MIDIYVASAFSKNHSGGNKAGVILYRQDLLYDQKREIATELGYSETAFISDSSKADFKLQYFTPTGEVVLCGHATIATFTVLRLLNLLDKQNYKIETEAGILNIQIKEDGLILMEQNRPTYLDIQNPEIFTDCVETQFINRNFPIQIVSTGLKDIILPVDSEKHLEQLKPDLELLKRLSKEKEIVGIHAFALSKEPAVTAICRNFAPLYGIDEESATGTSNCALACYLFKYYEQKTQYIFEQGYNLGEISRIVVNIAYHSDIIESVSVGGYGYLICKKTL